MSASRGRAPRLPGVLTLAGTFGVLCAVCGRAPEPLGALRHDGLFPSYAYRGFHGIWSWDSWKHARALALFAPELAKEQVRVLLARQDTAGMIPDGIYADSTEDNWRDTKPPLAARAVAGILEATADTAFVREVFPALAAYHAWWYAHRDHQRDGLCEYGSTDGTRIAAAWESGMDNAVRFDSASMVRNGERAWSLDQESVDLNAYLYAEKRYLALLAAPQGLADGSRIFENYDARTGRGLNAPHFSWSAAHLLMPLDAGDPTRP